MQIIPQVNAPQIGQILRDAYGSVPQNEISNYQSRKPTIKVKLETGNIEGGSIPKCQGRVYSDMVVVCVLCVVCGVCGVWCVCSVCGVRGVSDGCGVCGVYGVCDV